MKKYTFRTNVNVKAQNKLLRLTTCECETQFVWDVNPCET